MAISIDHLTRVIFVPQADLTPVGTALYELDVNEFRLWLKDLEDDADGMNMPDTHRHNTQVTLGGVTLARTVEIINGYTVEFEDGQYGVRLVGANNNIADVLVINQVSLRSNNSAGLIFVAGGEGPGGDVPTVQEIRLEMDNNSSKLAILPTVNQNVNDIEAAIGDIGSPPTVQEIRTEIDANSTRFTALDQAVAAIDPPTAAEIRAEIDDHSIDLDALQAAISALPAPPTAAAIRQEIDANSVDLNAIQAAINALPEPPSAAEIASATLGSSVETGMTFLQWLRLAAAAMFGAGEVPTADDGGFFFRDIANAKNRLAGTITNKVRAFTTRDGT